MALRLSTKPRVCIPKWAENDKVPVSDQIRCEFNPLTIEDVFNLQRSTKVNIFGGMQVDANNAESFEQYWTLIKAVISEYTKNYKNVFVDDEEITEGPRIAEVLRAEAIELLAEIFNAVMAESTGTQDDEKNSESESEPPSLDSDSTVEVASSQGNKKKETAAGNT